MTARGAWGFNIYDPDTKKLMNYSLPGKSGWLQQQFPFKCRTNANGKIQPEFVSVLKEIVPDEKKW
jgi:hypothetical protein